MTDKEKLFELVDRMPTFSQNVVRIIEVTSDINSAPKDLVHLIEHDPILTMKLLKLVNSAYFGLGKPVTSIRQGVVYVGVNTIKHLAVSIAAIGALPRTNQAGFSMDEFWSHSLVTAAIAKLLAARRGVPRAETTSFFIAGLLHDIGQVVLAQFASAEYSAVLEQARLGQEPLVMLEQQALGTTHAEIGAVLAEHWHLPPEFVAAIRNHHDAVAIGQGAMMDIVVFVANQLAKLQIEQIEDTHRISKTQIGKTQIGDTHRISEAQIGDTHRISIIEAIPDSVTRWLGMELEELPQHLPGLGAEIERARAFINVPMQAGA